MVMCPRARCGLWMRADRILEHILMVEPSNSLASSSSSSLSTPPSSGGLSSARLASSSSGRSHKNGITRSKTKFGINQSSQTSDNQQNRTSSAIASASTVIPNPLIPPCPGLTWEREQLARATGIIGHLTEENSSLRQMIRQLTLQNTKLTKEKDRLQRYANLGLGRD